MREIALRFDKPEEICVSQVRAAPQSRPSCATSTVTLAGSVRRIRSVLCAPTACCSGSSVLLRRRARGCAWLPQIIAYIAHMVRSGSSSRLHALRLKAGAASLATFKALAKQMHRIMVRRLEVQGCTIDAAAEVWATLGESPVTSLFVTDCSASVLPGLAAMLNSSDQVTRLSVTSCRLEAGSLAAFTAQLIGGRGLRSINLADNELTSIPVELLTQCPKLTDLKLCRNLLDPAGLGLLLRAPGISERLARLDLSRNKMRAFPAELSQCSNLSSLDFSHNKITTLPDMDWSALIKVDQLQFAGNPCLGCLPPEVTDHPQLLALYLNELRSGEVLCRRARLMVVGSSSVGKTVLTESLRGRPSKDSPAPTVGVEISDLLVSGSKNDKLVDAISTSPSKGSLKKKAQPTVAATDAEIRSRFGPEKLHVRLWDFGSQAAAGSALLFADGLYLVVFNASATVVGGGSTGDRFTSIPHTGSAKQRGLDAMCTQVLTWLQQIQSKAATPVR